MPNMTNLIPATVTLPQAIVYVTIIIAVAAILITMIRTARESSDVAFVLVVICIAVCIFLLGDCK